MEHKLCEHSDSTHIDVIIIRLLPVCSSTDHTHSHVLCVCIRRQHSAIVMGLGLDYFVVDIMEKQHPHLSVPKESYPCTLFMSPPYSA